MICPKCNTEYREGFYTCADCSVPLVVKHPEIKESQSKILQSQLYTGEFIEVLQTVEQTDFLTVKLAFDEEKIPNNFSGDFLLGDRSRRLARFFVPTEFKDRALEILKDLELNADQGISSGSICATDDNSASVPLNADKQPLKCPQCGHNDFMKLQPEKGSEALLGGIFSFFFDLIGSYDYHLHSQEALNRLRPGWMCKSCGKEIRVKQTRRD